MRLLTRYIHLLTALLLAAPTPSIATNIEKCKETVLYSDLINIIIYDGTTSLSDKAKTQFENGINSIAMDQNTNGRIQLFVVGPEDFTIEKKVDTCLPPMKTNSSHDEKNPPQQNKGLLSSLTDVFIPSAPSRDKQKENSTLSPTMQRAGIAQSLLKSALFSSSKHQRTCLINDLVHVVEDRPQNYRSIRVFCFTDLEDTILSDHLKRKSNIATFRNEATRQAQRHAATIPYNDNQKPNIDILFWGVGRNEDPNKLSLAKDDLEKLKTFWSVFLAEVFKSNFSNVRVSFFSEYPTR